MSGFSVSVIIPVYNAAKYLAQAVESALQQPEVGEVVLVDDGSTDDSFTHAQTLCDAHPERVRLYTHEGRVNCGPGKTRNLGLTKALCDFVAFLDADDWYLPGYFADAKAAFERDPELGMVRHPLGNAWDANDPAQGWFVKYTGKDRAKGKFHSRVTKLDPTGYFSSLYPLGDVGPGVAGTLTLRRALATAVGGFPNRAWAEDATFHLKLAAIGNVAFADMDTPLAMRRIHADNLTREMADKVAERIDSVGLALLDLASFLKERNHPRAKRAVVHRGWLRFARLFRQLGPYELLRKDPGSLLFPRVAWSYAKLTVFLVCRWGWYKLRALAARFRRSTG